MPSKANKCDDTELVSELKRERNQLKKQVLSMAKFNYAREPEFVRDRLKLRQMVEEVSLLVGRLQKLKTKAEPILTGVKHKFTNEAQALEEKSESMAQQFLKSKIAHGEFTEQYIQLRKDTNKKRILADRLFCLQQQQQQLTESPSATTRGCLEWPDCNRPPDRPKRRRSSRCSGAGAAA